LYAEHFGETKGNKKRPAVFIFDLLANSLKKVEFAEDIKDIHYPQHPIFDEDDGIVF
jgi:hypothetical protein